MRVIILGAIASVISLASCNNETKEAVKDADSTNEANGVAIQDSIVNHPTITEKVVTDKDGSEFLVRASAAGNTEVKGAKLGKEKAASVEVRRFSEMLERDHEAANMEVSKLATARDVTLPADSMNPMLKDLGKLEGSKFDRKYMDEMIKGHKKTIDLFEKYQDKTNDTTIRGFIQKTLPVLRQHLDSAEVIDKLVKKA